MSWGGETDDSKHERDVLENLLPYTTMKKIMIMNYAGTRFPNWLGDQSFCNIVDVHLQHCKCCDIMPPLGQLSSLKTLWIRSFDAVVMVGPEFYGNSSAVMKPFALLESLRFEPMPNLKEWSIPVEDAEAFPNLRELYIWNCQRLTGDMPLFLPSLTEFTIFDCPQLASSIPRMPLVRELKLLKCENLIRKIGYHMVESFVCLQH